MKRSGDRVIACDRVIGVGAQLIETPEVSITGSLDHRITRFSNSLFRCWGVIIATLHEIFDEAAYDRFLVRTRAARSVESYREFLREREAVIVRRPRCC
jgi:hypothetical protein